MKRFLTIIFLFYLTFGLSQPIENTNQGMLNFIGKQKNIKLVDGPYKIDTSNYFFVGKITTDTMYFFYNYKNNGFRLNDTYQYTGIEDLNEKLEEYHITTVVEKNETTIEKIEEYAYREQLILIQNKDYPDKFFKHKLLKVPYAKRVNGKWVDMDPPRVIWLDKDGKEIKRI
jgi:hypothetical protein